MYHRYYFKCFTQSKKIKRNIESFLEKFYFQINNKVFQGWKSQTVISIEEYIDLKAQIVTSSGDDITRNKVINGGNRYLPYVFTEHGVIVLSKLFNK